MAKNDGSCGGCSLESVGRGFVGIEGVGTSGVLVLSDMPGDHELSAGLPLRPQSPGGAIFAGLIRRIPGLERGQLTLASIIRCQAPRNWLTGAPWEFSATDQCTRVHLSSLIKSRRPRCILALGQNVLRALTGMSGYNQNIKLLRGFQLWTNRPEFEIDGKPIPVVGTYHPIFLQRASKTRAKKGEMAVEGGATGARVEKAEGGMALSGTVQRDIKLALQIAARGPMTPRVPEVIRGTPDVMRRLVEDYRARPEWVMHVDVETPRSIDKSADESEIDVIHAHVKQIQFGWNPHQGWVFPGLENDWVKDGARELFSLPNVKYTWNGLGFDIPVLAGHHGLPFSGKHVDLMNAWHWIQPDIPQGLQFATSYAAPDLHPWKHLALAEEDFYGANDVVAPELCRQYIWKEMERFGLVQAFERHCILLQREMHAVTLRGIPMDEERHLEFGKSVGEKIVGLEERIRGAVPEVLLILEPEREKELPDGTTLVETGFVRTPAAVKERLETNSGTNRFEVTELVEETQDSEDVEGEKVKVERLNTVNYVLKNTRFWDKKLGVVLEEPRWHRQLAFSPYSVPQKLAYIRFRREEEISARLAKGQAREAAERLAKYKVPMVTNKAKKKVENTGSKELAKLAKATGDPIFQDIVDITKNNKLLGTYGPKSKWRAKKDGRVHPTFGLSDTGTGQMASWDPNAQNAPKHGDLAQMFRRCVHAEPGHVLLEFDMKSFHAQTLALEARDFAYARMSAIDVHSFMTAHRLGLPEAHQLMSWSNEDLKAWFSKMKEDPRIYRSESGVAFPHGMTFGEVRDYKSKKVILGIGFGQGAHSIFEQNPEGYKDKKEVQTFLDLMKELFKPLFTWQGVITQLGHKQNYLTSRWGYIRRFYDIFQWDATKWNEHTGSLGDWGRGDEYEAAIAFLPANDAFGMLREIILRLSGYRSGEETEWVRGEDDLLEKYGFCNTIHDSLKFHCRKELAEVCIVDVLREMRKPCMTLADSEMCPGGFWVDAEVAMGDDWSGWAAPSEKDPLGNPWGMKKMKGV